MTRRTLYRTLAVTPPQGQPMRLEYYLLTDPARFDGGSMEVYGAEILLYRPDRKMPEIARARGITPIGSRILSILQSLCDGAVTPVALKEVMEELLIKG